MDFVDQFIRLTEASFSPEIFRKWAGIGLLAGTLERRVWIRAGNRVTFPNLYIMLVGPPGTGKQVIDDARDLAKAMKTPQANKALRIAPDSMTKASLMDEIQRARQVFLPKSGGTQIYHALFIFAEEISMLMPGYDTEILGVFNNVYKNPAELTETRRHGPVKEIAVPNPMFNFLAGVQPGWLATVFPEEAWNLGFASRLLMIYAPETPERDLFEILPDQTEEQLHIIKALERRLELWGEFHWEPEAVERLRQWHLGGRPPAPTHSKLEHYSRRRSQHLLKLVMIASASRGMDLVARLDDVNRALGWLLEAEALMPDIFRAMIGKSDSAVLDELYHFVVQLGQMSSARTVTESAIWNFLRARVPGEKIEKLVATAERSGMIARDAGTNNYRARPRTSIGVE